MVSVPDVEIFNSSVSIDTPMKSAVFFGGGDYSCDMRNKVIVVQAVSDNVTRIL